MTDFPNSRGEVPIDPNPWLAEQWDIYAHANGLGKYATHWIAARMGSPVGPAWALADNPIARSQRSHRCIKPAPETPIQRAVRILTEKGTQ